MKERSLQKTVQKSNKERLPIQFDNFEEVELQIKRHFLEDEWKSIETVLRKFYPGSLAELMTKCANFFEDSFEGVINSAQHQMSSNFVLLVYDFLNFLGVKKHTFIFQDSNEKDNCIKALAKLLRIVRMTIMPQLIHNINEQNTSDIKLSNDLFENVVEEIALIEGGTVEEVCQLSNPTQVLKIRSRGIPGINTMQEVLYWDSKNDFKDLIKMAVLLRDQYGCCMSSPDTWIKLFDIKNCAKKNPIRWNKDKINHLVVLIDLLYKDKGLPLKLTKGKGYWKAAQELFVDFSKKSLQVDFNKHHNNLKNKSNEYLNVKKEIREIIKDIQPILQIIP